MQFIHQNIIFSCKTNNLLLSFREESWCWNVRLWLQWLRSLILALKTKLNGIKVT